jgi:hypothetical protein
VCLECQAAPPSGRLWGCGSAPPLCLPCPPVMEAEGSANARRAPSRCGQVTKPAPSRSRCAAADASRMPSSAAFRAALGLRFSATHLPPMPTGDGGGGVGELFVRTEPLRPSDETCAVPQPMRYGRCSLVGAPRPKRYGRRMLGNTAFRAAARLQLVKLFPARPRGIAG